MSSVEHCQIHQSQAPIAQDFKGGILTYQVWPPLHVHGLGVVQLDVQVLVHALQRAADLHFVLEFDRDFVLDERLEEAGVMPRC